MPQVLARFTRVPTLSRFGWLMGLYAENFTRLTRLFEPADLMPGNYLSSVGDGLDLRVDVMMQHPYTTELRMTYAFQDPQTGEPDPPPSCACTATHGRWKPPTVTLAGAGRT